jgi:hypothetical protein
VTALIADSQSFRVARAYFMLTARTKLAYTSPRAVDSTRHSPFAPPGCTPRVTLYRLRINGHVLVIYHHHLYLPRHFSDPPLSFIVTTLALPTKPPNDDDENFDERRARGSPLMDWW